MLKAVWKRCVLRSVNGDDSADNNNEERTIDFFNKFVNRLPISMNLTCTLPNTAVTVVYVLLLYLAKLKH